MGSTAVSLRGARRRVLDRGKEGRTGMSHPFPVLISDRILLRAMRESDADGFRELLTDPSTYPRILESGPDPDAEARITRNIAAFSEGKSVYWSIDLAGTFVGVIAAHGELSEAPVLSYAIRPDWRRQGIAREALSTVCRFLFERIDASEVIARTHLDNEPSAALLLREGFRECGLVDWSGEPRREFRITRPEPRSSEVELLRIAEERAPTLTALLDEYLAELSAIVGGPSKASEYPYLPLYWKEPERHPYFIVASGEIAGFVLVRERRAGAEIELAEFCVGSGHRRCGLGRDSVKALWRHFPWQWQVRVHARNEPSRAFFESALQALPASVEVTSPTDGDPWWTLQLRP